MGEVHGSQEALSVLSVEEAQQRILSLVLPAEKELISLGDALGRVLFEALRAPHDLPAWDGSAMDGYAVRAVDVQDGSPALPVAFSVPAGAQNMPALPPRSAARIFTGAAMPAGADTVMIQENATLHQGEAGAPDQVTFSRAAIPHENVRRAGTDAMAGAHILPTGRVLSPGDISLFASLGLRQVQVFRRPVVGILSTGDELVDIDGPPLRPGQIRNSNAYALAAAVREAGGVPVVHPVVRDSYEEVRQAFSSATGADVLVSCGGMSVGDHDHVKSVIRELSGDTFGFWKVAVKPGKPVGFGHIDGCAVFGLPGNPVSALVTFELFVKPALLRLQGHTRCVPVARRAYARSEVPAGGKRTIYLRASASYDGDSGLWADVSRSQSSGAVTSMANADALVVVPPGAPVVAAGGVVRIIPLSTSIDRE